MAMVGRRKAVDLVEQVERAVDVAKRLRCLNIFITERFDEAVKEVREKSNSAEEGALLLNELVAVKDCFSTKNILTTCGSRMLANYKPPYTATVVQKLYDSGAVLFGKTNLDEFCMGASSTESYFGPVKNPWTLKKWKNEKNLRQRLEQDWYLTGGSSGGSAAAVASGLVRIGLGSDTGGSTRNPASFCGVVGLKPTYGLLSRHGLIPLTNSLDVPGIFARNVDDIALALDIMAGRDGSDSTSVDRPDESFSLPDGDDDDINLNGVTIGLPKEYFVHNLSKDVIEWWPRIAALLETKADCKLQAVSLPHTKFSIVCYHVLGETEISSNMARYDGLKYGYRSGDESSLTKSFAVSRQEAFNEVVRRRILAGNYFLLRKNYDRYFLKSLRVRRLIAEDFYNLFRRQNVDFLLTPVTLSDAPLYSEWKSDDDGYGRERSDDYFTQPVNMAGIPAITIPVGLSANGLPVGLQLIGDMFSERKLLTVAKWIEKQVEFRQLTLEDLGSIEL